jgi:hypothetical protein
MKKTLLISVFLILSSSIFTVCYGQSWVWGEQAICDIKHVLYANAIATDEANNVYVAGSFEAGYMIFGTDTLFGNSDEPVVYLYKFDSNGHALWPFKPGYPFRNGLLPHQTVSSASSIFVDNSGNVLVAGGLGTGGISPFGTDTLKTKYGECIFLARFDPNGNVLWAKQSTNNSGVASESAKSVTADINGNAYVTGYFDDSISFSSNILTCKSSQQDIFVTKYDMNGNVVWAKQTVCAANYSTSMGRNVVNSITTDVSGNIYVTGGFADTITFGAFKLFSPKLAVFLVKYDANGNVLWAKQTTGLPVSAFSSSSAMAYSDKNKCLYITGTFGDTIKFGTDISMGATAGANTFFAKYDLNGDCTWAKQFAGGTPNSLSVDNNGMIYLSGTGSHVITSGFLTLSGKSWINNAPFIIKFDTIGNSICGSILNDASSTMSPYVAAEKSGGSAYLIGSILIASDTIYCGSDTVYVESNGDGNVFLVKWKPCSQTLGMNNIGPEISSVSVFPNPSNGSFTIRIKGKGRLNNSMVEVYNMLGEKVYHENLKNEQPDNDVNLSGQPSGVYLYRVINEQGSLVGDGKLIIE